MRQEPARDQSNHDILKKHQLVRGKPDGTAQRAHLVEYKHFEPNKGESGVNLLMDAIHPQHSRMIDCGRIRPDEDRVVPLNTGGGRLVCDGARKCLSKAVQA